MMSCPHQSSENATLSPEDQVNHHCFIALVWSRQHVLPVDHLRPQHLHLLKPLSVCLLPPQLTAFPISMKYSARTKAFSVLLCISGDSIHKGGGGCFRNL